MVLLFDDYPLSHYFLKLFNFEVDLEDESHKSCLGLLHVQNSVKLFLLFEIFVVIPSYVLSVFPWWITWIGLHLVIILVTIYAIGKKKHLFMWPFIMYSGIQFVVWSILTIFQFIIAVFSTDTFLAFYGQQFHEGFFARAIVVLVIKTICLLIAAFLYWRVRVFYDCKKYFAERQGRQQVPTTETTTTSNRQENEKEELPEKV